MNTAKPRFKLIAARRDREAAMPFIMLTALIDMVAIGLIIPVLPALVGSFTGTQADQAFWYGVVAFAFSAANFLASPILGALSDRHGRRPVLLLGFCGLALSFFATALATAVWMLIAVRLVSGAMQSNLAVANAYVADITPAENRAKRFGLLGAMFGVGFILGPVMGGLLGAINLRLPFFVAGSLALLNLLYGYFVLPESLPAERRHAFHWRAANPVAALRRLAQLKGAGRLAIVVACTGLAQFRSESGCGAAPPGPVEGRGTAGDRGRLHRTGAVRALHLLGAVHHVQVRLGAAANRLVARRGRHRIGDRTGPAARPPAQALQPAAAGGVGAGVLHARLRRLGRRHAGLDAVRDHRPQSSRPYGVGFDPEHYFGRRGRAQPGQHARRGERPQQPDGGDRADARRAAAGDGVAPAEGRLAYRHAVLLLRPAAGNRTAAGRFALPPPTPRARAARGGLTGLRRPAILRIAPVFSVRDFDTLFGHTTHATCFLQRRPRIAAARGQRLCRAR